MASAALHIMLLCSNSGKEAGPAAAAAADARPLLGRVPCRRCRKTCAGDAAVTTAAAAAVAGRWREEEGSRGCVAGRVMERIWEVEGGKGRGKGAIKEEEENKKQETEGDKRTEGMRGSDYEEV